MGNTQNSVKKLNFEDVQFIIKTNHKWLIINTLGENDQKCLIKNTMNYENEEKTINNLIENGNNTNNIMIYGRNCNDETVGKKYNQLASLGFCDIQVYMGGMFEWLVLQDIYGDDQFPTTFKELDILKYKPDKLLLF